MMLMMPMMMITVIMMLNGDYDVRDKDNNMDIKKQSDAETRLE